MGRFCNTHFPLHLMVRSFFNSLSYRGALRHGGNTKTDRNDREIQKSGCFSVSSWKLFCNCSRGGLLVLDLWFLCPKGATSPSPGLAYSPTLDKAGKRSYPKRKDWFNPHSFCSIGGIFHNSRSFLTALSGISSITAVSVSG